MRLAILALFATLTWTVALHAQPATQPVAQPQKQEEKKESEEYKSPKLNGDPVVQPKKMEEKKEEKKADEDEPKVKPVVASDDKTTLPLGFVKNKLEDMKVGTDGYIPAAAVKCDYRRKCWLDPATLYSSQTSERVVSVRRDEDGYHLTIPDNLDHQWVAGDIPQGKAWISVKSITVRK